MSASRAGKRGQGKSGRGAKTRSDSKKGPVPEVRRLGRVRPVREDEEPAAENDEEDD